MQYVIMYPILLVFLKNILASHRNITPAGLKIFNLLFSYNCFDNIRIPLYASFMVLLPNTLQDTDNHSNLSLSVLKLKGRDIPHIFIIQRCGNV